MDDSERWMLVGGRSRLGRALAERFAPDHGLVLTSSRPWDETSSWVSSISRQVRARTFQWDANDPGIVPTMMADMKTLGDAGITLGNVVIVAGTFPEGSLGHWDSRNLAETWQINLTFPMLVIQTVVPHLVEGGCIQLLLDTAIHRAFLKHLPYSAAKAGLAALVPGLARQLAPRIRVVGHAIGTALPNPASDPADLASRNLLKRLGTPDDLARAIRYAAESPCLTGEVLTLDGGRRWA